jgi:pimeloyl-ACP methyl ester carboxylesterase
MADPPEKKLTQRISIGRRAMVPGRDYLAPPSAFLVLTELPRALAELGSLPLAAPLLMTAQRGDGHPVLVLPGLSTTDRSTSLLRRYLSVLGYDVHAWELGRNLGPKAIGSQGEKLIARLEAIYANTGQKVTLVGHSLGGIIARQLSRRRPDMVRQIVTLGSPFAGDPRSTNVWKLYEYLCGQRVSDPDIKAQLIESHDPPPVPSTAIYSKADGIVAWQSCIEPNTPTTDNIEIPGSHVGLCFNPIAMYAVADRLAQPLGHWKPFGRSGLRALFYRSGNIH